jgi:hypothetical protein
MEGDLEGGETCRYSRERIFLKYSKLSVASLHGEVRNRRVGARREKEGRGRSR